MDKRILVIEDDPDTRVMLEFALRAQGFEARGASDGQHGLALARDWGPDLVVLDLLLPGLGGLEVCALLRRDPRTARSAVVVLTANDSESNRVAAFEQGADDCLSKPFSLRELTLRIRNILRRLERVPSPPPGLWRRGELSIDFEGFAVESRGTRPRLTAAEFQLLGELARHEGRVLSRGHLSRAVRGRPGAVSARAVDTMIRRLRRKLGPCGEYLKTERGFGYLLSAQARDGQGDGRGGSPAF